MTSGQVVALLACFVSVVVCLQTILRQMQPFAVSEAKRELSAASTHLRNVEKVLRDEFGEANAILLLQVPGATVEYRFSPDTQANDHEMRSAIEDLKSGKKMMDSLLGTDIGVLDLTLAQIKRLMPLIKSCLGVSISSSYPWPHKTLKAWSILKRKGRPVGPGARTFSKANAIDSLAWSVRYSEEWRIATARACKSSEYLRQGILDRTKRTASSLLDKGQEAKRSKLDSFTETRKSTKPSMSPEDQIPASSNGNGRPPEQNTKVEVQEQNDKLDKADANETIFHYYLRNVPGDGSCLFHAVLLGMNETRKTTKADETLLQLSVPELRSALRVVYHELANAGLKRSRFRREWLLAAAIWDITRSDSSNLVEDLDRMDREQNDEAIERILRQVRASLRDRGDQLSGKEWGGDYQMDFMLLATVLGIVVEVWTDLGGKRKEDTIQVIGDGVTAIAELVGVFLPEWLHLPSKGDGEGGFLTGYHIPVQGDRIPSNSYPVVRLFRSGPMSSSHYQLMVSDFFQGRGDSHEEERAHQSSADFIQRKVHLPYLTAPFSSLDDSEVSRLKDAVLKGSKSPTELMRKISSIQLKYEDFQRVLGFDSSGTKLEGSEAWYNDSIIAAYFHLLQKRHDVLLSKQNDLQSTQVLVKAEFMQPFFGKSLLCPKRRSRFGYSDLMGEIKKRDLFTKEMILIPICVELHWILAVVDIPGKAVYMYDSTGDPRLNEGRAIAKFGNSVLQDALDTTEWIVSNYHCIEKKFKRFIDTQSNIVDCGVFVCKAAESVSLSSPISFRQEDMIHIRRRVFIELLSEEATPLHQSRTSFIFGTNQVPLVDRGI